MNDSCHESINDIPQKILADCIFRRRIKSYGRHNHKRTATPSSDATCNTEIAPFKGFFDHYEMPGLDYPLIKINWNLSEENSPSPNEDVDWLN